MRSSLSDVSNMPKPSSFSVVDLNNKETTSILLLRMKSQEQKQLELRRLKQIMVLQSQSTSSSMPEELISGMSSSSCSSISPLSPTQSLSPTTSSSTSFTFNNSSANSSSANSSPNSSVALPDRSESIDLNSSYPLYKRLYNNLNYRQHQFVSYAFRFLICFNFETSIHLS